MAGDRVLLSEEEILEKIQARTDGELISFSDKLRAMDTPQAWALRFAVTQVLLSRAISA